MYRSRSASCQVYAQVCSGRAELFPARSSYEPPLIAPAAKARRVVQGTAPTKQRSLLVVGPDADQETYTSAFGKSRGAGGGGGGGGEQI
jgi:hypothetical protein